MKTLIISPTYNEIKNISLLIENLFSINKDYDILIIDDNSPDGTGAKVKELQKQYPNLYIVERPKKSGLGTAYLFGFKWALNRKYDAIVQIDADLSHNPNDVPKLISRLGKYDLVIGSRYVKGVSVVNWPIQRLILSYGANIYTRLITAMPINDGTGGFKAWRSELLSKIALDKIKSQGYSFQIEMNFRSWVLDAKIKEEPIIFVDRTIGHSKMSKKIMREAVWMVWRLRISKIFGWI